MNRLKIGAALFLAVSAAGLLGGGVETASARQPAGPNPRACEHPPRANRDHGQQRAAPSAVNCVIEELPGF
ncbi:MAG: hypothetical protein AB7T37_13810 [Dehalococcoidia bacterium]